MKKIPKFIRYVLISAIMIAIVWGGVEWLKIFEMNHSFWNLLSFLVITGAGVWLLCELDF